MSLAPFVPEPPPALVISLDLELHWGVRDKRSVADYEAALRGVRAAVPALLELFARRGIRCTWAAVGMLFARSRGELEESHPRIRPRYRDPRLDPFGEPVGDGPAADPYHFAPDLLERIIQTPGQEIGTHTWSHYYCLEPGQGIEAFDADLAAAAAKAREWGLDLRSLVFPRNQHNPAYADVLRRHGIRAYRGNPIGFMHDAEGADAAASRCARLADTYLPLTGSKAFAWRDVAAEPGLVNVRASHFLRPAPGGAGRLLEPLRLRRLVGALRSAAARGELVHLWWHPHNFGVRLEDNLRALNRVLDHFDALRREFGMESLAMADVAERSMQSEADEHGASSAPIAKNAGRPSPSQGGPPARSLAQPDVASSRSA